MEIQDVLSQFLISDADDAAQRELLLNRLAAQGYLDEETGLLNRAAFQTVYATWKSDATVGIGILRGTDIQSASVLLKDYFDFEVLYRLDQFLVVAWPDVDHTIFRTIGTAMERELRSRQDTGVLLFWFWDDHSVENLQWIIGRDKYAE